MLKIKDSMTGDLKSVISDNQTKVKIYTCGPTVYRSAHLGNMRTYLMADWIRRVISLDSNIKIFHVKNITDVGHMRQERLELGEDRVISAAINENKTASEIADFYTSEFFRDEKKLNIIPAEFFPKATENINEMIEIIEKLLIDGFAYEVLGNIYYNVDKWKDYGILSGNNGSDLLEAVRIKKDLNKLDPRDFTLWKKAEKGRTLKWESPWGEGFPGWHIECSAMSIKYLGKSIDIHTGGVDNLFPHHEDEIAQSDAFNGVKTVKTWVHGQHLLWDGVKMSKSEMNDLTVSDLENKGFDPIAFRYLCLTSRYYNRLHFSISSIKSAQNALKKIRQKIWIWSENLVNKSSADQILIKNYKLKFHQFVSDNLNLPLAVSHMWEVVHSDLSDSNKFELLLYFDKVFGLGLDSISKNKIDQEINSKMSLRSDLRLNQNYSSTDKIRSDIAEKGYLIEDTSKDSRIRPLMNWESPEKKFFDCLKSPKDFAFFPLNESEFEITVGLIARNDLDDITRFVSGCLNTLKFKNSELLIVNNSTNVYVHSYLANLNKDHQNVRVIHLDHNYGEATAKNIILKQSRGEILILMDVSTEVIGDIFTPIKNILSDEKIGVCGIDGLTSDDFRHFHEDNNKGVFVDAMQAYCFAFRRNILLDVGLMRENFRFYRNLDLDFSLQIKNLGYKIFSFDMLPLNKHEHWVFQEYSSERVDELSKKNYKRFLKKWDGRNDLLVKNQKNQI